ncbi:M13 family metallopeptidase [Spirosoma sp. KUDC1026]|uniref:M13 family metallopeptidase n=1 Tax=Spirosoma sp. KUDC1026 TaxID=2745947 RepID=UPI001E5FF9F8|nr:M13 family metallopeptidase [Spirosoma sp. KUDC1026]
MDTTIAPGDDFFAYANGNWLKATKIPDDQVGWGSFNTLYEENLQRTKTILDEAAKADPKPGSSAQKLGDFYLSGLDTNRINALGYTPLEGELIAIRALTDYKSVLTYLTTTDVDPGGKLLGFRVAADDRQNTINRINFVQAGLSLPERSYYTRQDSATRAVRKAFVHYVATLFRLTGVDARSAQTKADAILAFEMKLAGSHKPPAELGDPVANYHRLAVADLSQQMPNLAWRELLDNLGLNRVDTVLMAQPAYYKTLNELLPLVSVDDLKDYLTFTLLDDKANLLSQPFQSARFAFRDKMLYGQKQQTVRWKRVAVVIDQHMGDVLGRRWVARYFPPAAKTRLAALVDNLQRVYRERIEQLDWMTPKTKRVALIKLENLVKRIGYPTHWDDYGNVVIKQGDFFGNAQRLGIYQTAKKLAKVDRPVDPEDWLMTPITVNAYANPADNEIVFPAGILQFPFFDKDADDAINYGAIGMVIGHEMTHLFDNQGRQYDQLGQLRDWWTKSDAALFTKKTDALVNQFSKYTIAGQYVDGRLTLSENLADLGGVTLAYQAFKETKQGRGNTKINGFSPDQRFFLGFAQIWRFKFSAEAERLSLVTNPHAPVRFRVNGTLTNFSPFYQAFGVKRGERLYKADGERVVVW